MSTFSEYLGLAILKNNELPAVLQAEPRTLLPRSEPVRRLANAYKSTPDGNGTAVPESVAQTHHLMHISPDRWAEYPDSVYFSQIKNLFTHISGIDTTVANDWNTRFYKKDIFSHRLAEALVLASPPEYAQVIGYAFGRNMSTKEKIHKLGIEAVKNFFGRDYPDHYDPSEKDILQKKVEVRELYQRIINSTGNRLSSNLIRLSEMVASEGYEKDKAWMATHSTQSNSQFFLNIAEVILNPEISPSPFIE